MESQDWERIINTHQSLMHDTRVHASQQTPYPYYVKFFTILVKFKNNISISFPKCTLNDLYSINI